MSAVNLYEAKTQLSSLVEKAARGEETVICKAGKPMARLVALPQTAPIQRRFGQNEMGISFIADDFEAPVWTDEELDEMGL